MRRAQHANRRDSTNLPERCGSRARRSREVHRRTDEERMSLMRHSRLALLAAIATTRSAATLAPAQTAKKPGNPAAPATAKAPAPAKALTAEQILDKAIEMNGGKTAYQQHSSFTMKGTFTIPNQNMSGTVEVYSKAPDKSLT